jgi:ketosteroid isomerase-like protein
MKPHLFLLSAALLAACGTTGPASSPSPEAELTALMNQWAQARVDADIAFLECFYGAELRLNQMNGGVASRAEDIAAFANGMIKPEYVRDTELSVNVYGDAAIVTGHESVKGVAFGVPGEMSMRVTNVLVRRDGRWQLVHHQSTAMR